MKDIGFAIFGREYFKDCPPAKLDIVQSFNPGQKAKRDYRKGGGVMDIGFAVVGTGYCKDCPQANLDILQTSYQSFNLNEDRTLNTIYCRNEHVCRMWIEKLEEIDEWMKNQ